MQKICIYIYIFVYIYIVIFVYIFFGHPYQPLASCWLKNPWEIWCQNGQVGGTLAPLSEPEMQSMKCFHDDMEQAASRHMGG